MKKHLIFVWIIAALPALAQRKASPNEAPPVAASVYHIGVVARNYGDSVVLRFAPQEALFWKAAIRAGGFTVKRLKIQNGQTTETNQATIRPWALADWKQRTKPTDSTAAACAQLMYGKIRTFDTQKPNLNDLVTQKNDQNTMFAFALLIADASPLHAQGMGLRFVDKTVRKKERYLYTVQLLNTPNFRHEPAKVVVETDEVYQMPSLPPIRVKSLDRQVEISWDNRLSGNFFSSYWIEKSDNNGQTFRRINKRPWVPDAQITALYTDSLRQNYRPYQYRIVGITPFGELSEPSVVLTVAGRDMVAPTPVSYLKAEHITGKQVRLTWEKKIIEPDLAGFIVGRANNAEGPFLPISTNILSKNTQTFTDQATELNGMNYYVVSAIDTARNVTRSIPAYVMLKDNDPPSKPKGLRGSIDTLGIVRLQWTPNPEIDTQGYMVYFANDPKHEFIPLTTDFLAEPFFTDSITLKTLSKDIYYKIMAFDMHQNPSGFSDIATIRKPDRVAPVAPVFERFFVSDTAVSLSWQNSVSEDAVSQLLYRKEGKGNWREIAQLPQKQQQFIDKTIKPSTAYSYALAAVDDAGLRSMMSFPLKVTVYKSGYQPVVAGLSAQLSADKKTVLLRWNKPNSLPSRIIIYRQSPSSPLTFYEKIDGATVEFKDKFLGESNYQYAIKAIYANNDETPLSPLVMVNR
jgi:uncharacterized protein